LLRQPRRTFVAESSRQHNSNGGADDAGADSKAGGLKNAAANSTATTVATSKITALPTAQLSVGAVSACRVVGIYCRVEDWDGWGVSVWSGFTFLAITPISAS
jgi:hypothetical protein